MLPKIEQLHRAIALGVVAKRPRLTAAEIRFLRKYLGWSGAAFAKHMGVTPESVSRWENDREQMGAVADRLLRLMVVTRAPVSEYERLLGRARRRIGPGSTSPGSRARRLARRAGRRLRMAPEPRDPSA